MKLIILDRDGVVNHDSDNYIKSPAEWRPIPGSIEAIARLNQAGYRIAVATNQSGIGRGPLRHGDPQCHQRQDDGDGLRQGGRIDAVFFCPHTACENCGCRKPKTGMYEEIAARFHTELKGVPCVGDSLKDLQSAEAVGGQPILVLTGKGRLTREAGTLPRKTLVSRTSPRRRHLVSQGE
jgi:D-glycero-D-manno-heptose 1,7-bisphosphate phosphatase